MLLTITITVGSLVSLENGLGIDLRFSDKILHSFGYCLLTISWLFAFRPKKNPMGPIILIASAIFIYGIIIEILQGVFTNNRQVELNDVFANLVGVIVAAIFFALVLKKNNDMK